MDCAKAELADCDVNTTFVDTVTAPDLSHTIANLKNYTEYNIEIELFNGRESGPKSPVIVIYTDEDGRHTPKLSLKIFGTKQIFYFFNPILTMNQESDTYGTMLGANDQSSQKYHQI